MIIFDAHLDLSMNAMEWNRDLRRPIEEIRARESKLTDKPDRGKGTVSFPEMHRGKVGLCVGTLIARYAKPTHPLPGWRSPEQAWAQLQGQLSWYKIMEETGQLKLLTSGQDVQNLFDRWSGNYAPDLPIGFVLSLENADGIVTVRHLERLHAQGLRAIGPAHYGPGTYAQGTDWKGGIGVNGRDLLTEMDRLKMILDATHLCDDSFWEALDHFPGPVWASHSNVRSLVPHNRQFSDEQLKALIARGAVIGAAFDAWMLVPNWVRGKSTPESTGVCLATVANHMDYICQLVGNCDHVGIGSDLDGAFGREQSPKDLETIADLQKLIGIFEARGYRLQDIEKIMHGNFLGFLKTHLK